MVYFYKVTKRLRCCQAHWDADPQYASPAKPHTPVANHKPVSTGFSIASECKQNATRGFAFGDAPRVHSKPGRKTASKITKDFLMRNALSLQLPPPTQRHADVAPLYRLNSDRRTDRRTDSAYSAMRRAPAPRLCKTNYELGPGFARPSCCRLFPETHVLGTCSTRVGEARKVIAYVLPLWRCFVLS